MKLTAWCLAGTALMFGSPAAAQDVTPHTVRFVTVQPDVQVEVLDFGGPATTGSKTIVLLTGLGDTAHTFDAFALQLAKTFRVFAVTRRGFGASSVPASGYGADRLGDDVLAVMDALKLTRPVLAGHSLGGEELSSIGSRHPDKVSGLVYLDAGYGYAYAGPGTEPMKPPPPGTAPPVIEAIITGMQQYHTITVPILAIYAVPRRMPTSVSAEDRARTEELDKMTLAQANAFEKGLPSARVVRLPNAGHYVHRTNEAEVLREMTAFIAGLK
jgi:pimeloyl-ACP methyl ester carboxylesterase